ncbi:hypothetical protein D1AOALGA4SA_86 [Olavius algarvensis Delta 1 endosymbiont]|nr:hypothetical protein D1AOALGA4SA_86 [Olavius algarvensis Delta 1 endosymbiont]
MCPIRYAKIFKYDNISRIFKRLEPGNTQVVRFRVQRSGLKTANHFILIGYYQQHVHKTVSPNG